MKKLVVILGLLALAGVIAVVAGPRICHGFYQSRCSNQPVSSCLNNLRFLDGMKQLWALEKHKGTNDTPTMADLAPYMGDQARNCNTSCPLGGVYSLRRVGEEPTCSLKGHQLP
jgi:hypothetical protein